MWKTKFSSIINGSITKAWEVLVTPGLWTEVDPTHYKEVEYPKTELKVGVKGKMKTENSPKFSFKVVLVNNAEHKVVTESSIPFGALRITKQLSDNGQKIQFDETVEATGPFAKLFSKLFFKKQIEASLPAQHEAIKRYVEKS